MSDDPFRRIDDSHPFALANEANREASNLTHVHLMRGHRCATDERGYGTPNDADPTELVLDTHLGFVPLWARDTTLRWRFNERSFAIFRNPEAAKDAVRQLMRESLGLWGNAVPVRFSEQRDLHDFEVVMVPRPDCENGGCVLASAFFPDGGRHELRIYPTMFEQDRQEQVETLAHEFGHIFGLRHWFAAVSETGWPSTIFGSHDRFTIMNYGPNSTLTESDRNDLIALYQAVWSGSLTRINGTPVRLFRPYSSNL